MKCENSLVLLLEAEREELEGRGSSALAMHVRECARCGAVAARLLADTRVLAARVATREVAPRSALRVVSRPIVWGGALAAAAAVAMLLMPVREVRVVPETHVQTIARVSPAPATASSPQPAPLVRIRETRYAIAVAATPVRLIASQDVEAVKRIGDSNGVSVIPPAGTRSAVLATRNEKITIVWLY